MDSNTDKIRERKKAFTSHHGGVNDDVEVKERDLAKSDDDKLNGIGWGCTIIILATLFTSVFLTSLSFTVRGMLPMTIDRIGRSLWQVERSVHASDKAMDDVGRAGLAAETNQDMVTESNSIHGADRRDDYTKAKKQGKKKQNPKPILDKPTILWWTDALFPHAHRGKISEITCGKHRCLSSSDKQILSDPLTRGILFYGTDFRAYEAPLPRKPWHEWALLHEESPMNNYALVHAMKHFNHTATFRRESDYPTTTHSLPSLGYLSERKPVPIALKNELRKKEELAPILYVQSHCDVAADRDRYVGELMKHVKVDSYGKCLNNKQMPDHLNDPVESMEAEPFYDFIANYKFHLAFENALCDDYITEKFFRPFHVGSVPIYRGSSSAKDWAPSVKSFIDVRDFESPEQLAYFIKLLDEHDDIYSSYLTFKEKGVSNQALIDHMTNRDYAVNEWDKHSFISGFECHVCEKISERFEAEQGGVDPSHPLLERKIGKSVQMGCPPPDAAVGSLEDIPGSEGIHAWVEDYWGMRAQAVALERMIRDGERDPSRLFEIIEKLHNEQRVST